MIPVEKFYGVFTTITGDFLARLDRNFHRLSVDAVELEFINTTSGSVSRYLPTGDTNPVKSFRYVKTDSSANTVTIYPTGTQLIMATTSLTLAAQGDSAHLTFDRASQTWWLT